MSNVTVYTTSSCPYCVMLTNYLKEQNIAFTEVNVEHNEAEMKKVVNKTGQYGVPQTEVNGKWILGFAPDQIISALNYKEVL